MRLALATIGAAAAIIGATFGAPTAEARFYAPGLEVPSAVEQVACRVVRERRVRPSGRVVVTTRRVCTPGRVVVGPRRGCRVVKERTVRPNGSVVVRTVRRCR